jgi:hypothetical protein
MSHAPATDDMIIRPPVAESERPAQVDHGPGQVPRRLEYHPDDTDALARLIGWAHADGIELAGWPRGACATPPATPEP